MAGRARVSWWVAALSGPPVARRWLLDVELGWYAVVLVIVVVGRVAGFRPTAAARIEYAVMAALAVGCCAAALARWWRPSWTGPVAVVVATLGVAVLALRPLGPLGPLRLMLSAAALPVLLAAVARRADRLTVAVMVVLVAVGAGLDVGRGGNTLSIDLASRFIGANPSRQLVVATAALLIVLPLLFGLVLRSTDTARRAELLARVRAEERLGVARELHDLVANHVTGIVIAAQAAGMNPTLPETGARAFTEIEAAGNRALAAMQRMVSALRTGGLPDPYRSAGVADGLPAPAMTAVDAVREASGGDERVQLRVGVTLSESGAESPEVAMTLHRIVVEALTNARRHAPAGSTIDVELDAPGPEELSLTITNERARGPGRVPGGGHGLIGLTERAAAVGGRLEAGPLDDRRWRVTTALPR